MSFAARFGVTGVTALLSLASSAVAFGWGAIGHRLVAKVGANLSEQGDLFWNANEAALEDFSLAPDVLWKSGASASQERPTHYFHFDVYSPSGEPLPTLFQSYEAVVREYTERVVLSNGTGAWRVGQFFLAARDAFSGNKALEGLQWAGAMAHYVADLAQPLHVTQNYDGQLTDQKGIHAWFESRNLENVSLSELEERVEVRARELLARPDYRETFASPEVTRAVLLGVQRSAQKIETVLSNDKTYGRKGEGSTVQLDLAVDRLADSAASYALLLSRLWEEGGMRNEARRLAPTSPVWRAPEYGTPALFCEEK